VGMIGVAAEMAGISLVGLENTAGASPYGPPPREK